jgi:ribosomal protein L25 (general stress protein Ctc)
MPTAVVEEVLEAPAIAETPVELKASERDETLNPRQLRSAGFIPATLYGGKRVPLSFQVKDEEFVRLFGRKKHRLFVLVGLPTEPNLIVRVKQVQVKPVSQKVQCIEFMVA